MTATLSIVHTWDGGDAPAGERATVTLRWVPGGLGLAIDAPFHADPPPPARPGPCDRLWEYEVVAVFLAGSAPVGEPLPYTEIELSPHGHYLVLRLLGVRNAIDLALPLACSAEIHGPRWRGRAVLPFSYLPDGALRGNAYAVHGLAPERRYLAASPVPGTRPDFHQPERFLPLALGPREAGAARREA